jgi:hypothetical protein
MMENLAKLQILIREYGSLSKLRDLTPQERGRRLNSFLAELLQCWGISAMTNIRENGEIDVAFGMNGRKFILECKWEENHIGTGPIAKLQKRLRQRLGGTTGLFLSMSGFSQEALNELKDGEQLQVLLLQREHLEAMLSGFVPPNELISILVDKASFSGVGFVPLDSLFKAKPVETIEINYGYPDSITRGELVTESIPGFRADVIASNLSVGQAGVAKFSKNKVLLTLSQGIYILDHKRKTCNAFLEMANCSRNVLVTKDGAVYVVRQAGVGRMRNGKFCVVGGAFPGNVCLFLGNEEEIWTFANGSADGIVDSHPVLTQLGESLGDEKRYEIDLPSACGTNAALIGADRFLIIGSSGINVVDLEGSKKLISVNLSDPNGLVRLAGEKFIIASDAVELSELNVLDGSIRRIAKFKLRGAISELALSIDGGGYLFTRYAKSKGENKGILIRWHY